MYEYPKIDNIFERFPNHKFDLSKLKNPLIEHVRLFHWTEKVHGMNIRIIWDGVSVKLGGRTDGAILPGRLKEYLNEKFTAPKLDDCFGNKTVVLYGEGYGQKINNGGLYTEGQKFVLFDVVVIKEYGQFWLNHESISEVATRLELELIPSYGYKTLEEAIEIVKKPFKSNIFADENNKPEAEGLVGKSELYDNHGRRFVIKLKTCDFE